MFDVLLEQGGAALVVLVVVALEAAVLTARSLRAQGAPVRVWVSQMCAGAALALTLLLSQREAPPAAIGLCLVAAGLAHGAGFRHRWGI